MRGLDLPNVVLSANLLSWKKGMAWNIGFKTFKIQNKIKGTVSKFFKHQAKGLNH